jgi:hypothetical protein
LDDDEVFALVVAFVIAIAGVATFVVPLLAARRLRSSKIPLLILATLAAAMIFLYQVLRRFSAHDVRDDAGYLTLFLAAGFASQTVVLRLSPILGISWRDDAVERRNYSAAAVTCGAIAGSGLVFAGSNIGEGPTIWTTLGPAFLGMLLWASLWIAAQWFADVAEAIAVERDLPSGIRMGAMLAANGLILGRALAGDWISLAETFDSLIYKASPAAAITLLAIVFHRAFPPNRRGPHLLWTALLPAGTTLLLAILWVILLGHW